MNHKEINTKFFQKLIERYLEGETTAEELKLLVNYYESFQKENEWVEALGEESVIKDRMLLNILEAIKEDDSTKTKVINLFKRNVIKYSFAASVAILLTVVGFFKTDKSNIIEVKTTVVNTSIEVGTDKAILTREDGSTVALEKGEKFVAENVKSNGEELVYNQQNRNSYKTEYNYLSIPRGGEFFLKLADGTKVWLNSETKLKYPVAFPKDKDRFVELVYGEAYFEVSPSTKHNGAKFLVTNNNHEVEVLGTKFNIKAYSDEAQIITTLVEGKVNVNYQDKKYLLAPNQQSSLNRKSNKISFKEVDVYHEISWVKGEFSFNNKTFKEIMKVLSRWHDFETVFKSKNVEKEQFVGVLGKNEKIEDILQNVKNLGIIKDFKFDNKTIIIE